MLTQLSNEIVQNVFPEEKRRLLKFLRHQKRRSRAWLVFATVAALLFSLLNIQSIAPFVVLNLQRVLNTVLFFWIIALVLIPFIWPFKDEDTFSEDFKRGLDPRTWQYEGDWKVELAEDGKSVLTVTNSNIGGFALPCVHWTDYELQFEMRILNRDAGWIVRASGLYDYVVQKIDTKQLVTFYRIAGVFPEIGRFDHRMPIVENAWYPIRLLARGEWLSVYITVEGSESLIFQDRALGDKPPITVLFKPEKGKKATSSAQAIMTPSFRAGSFGFRVHGDEKAQYRKVRAYRLL